ncbi:murein transglycosylase A [Desulfospira joergensenii]|uniref:murein transglycosylase A n=1 Tax=Desulfospira joergensenii TaxID=53329 RepID=UPI0003B426AE|nr:murein transglycosylase A [Desulfospira joergensenii]
MENRVMALFRPGSGGPVAAVWALVLVLICLGGFLGCGPSKGMRPGEEGFPLKKLKPRQYPRFEDSLGFKDLCTSLENSLTYFSRVPKGRTYTLGREVYPAGHMARSIEVFRDFLAGSPSVKELNSFIKKKFIVYESVGNPDHEVLFTGYFEPVYEGSLSPGPEFEWPLFSLPSDLLKIDLSLFSDRYKGHKSLTARVDGNRVLPYFTREEINLLKDFSARAEPVIWLKDRVDRFFLEVQGSGRIRVPGGEEIRVHYAGSNGNPYRSVGRYLIDQEEILKEDMSMAAIRNWLEANPLRMDEVLHHNPSFVFFQQEEGGPYGSIGVELTPLRSIATDHKLFPWGGLGFMMAALPDPEFPAPRDQWAPASFFVMNQDTGGAIRGPGRADLFCGSGTLAEFTAGNMNTPGRLFFLVLAQPDSPGDF